MATTVWRPDWRTALPRVFYVRWWLFRLGMVVVVFFAGAAAAFPPPSLCGQLYFISHRVAGQQVLCTDSWEIGLRLAIVGIGVAIALLINFVGARLDAGALRRRRARGWAPTAPYST